MADFNKIFTNSSLSVNRVSETKLCFNDGKVIPNDKYSLDNNMLLLSISSNNTISIYCNHGIATTYEFDVNLDRNNTKLQKFDNYEKSVEDVVPNKTLLFIDGLLQQPDEYRIENNKDIYITYPHATEDNDTSKVIIYSSRIDITRVCYDNNPDSANPKISSLKQEGQKHLLDSIKIPGIYNKNTTLVFINSQKIDFNAIEDVTLNKNGYSYIKINADIQEEDIETLEFVIFSSEYDNTYSLHFKTEHGYLEYGPLDYYGISIPNPYDITFTFNDQAKLIVDNIRYGFIIKEVNGYGEAVITDTSFETRTVKGLAIQVFNKSNYDNNEYYLEVPQYTNIIKYLAEYDNKYTFLPEILNVFQRLILDEIQDTIQRLRDSRSIYKVDSVSINKLLAFLGSNLNIKTLNKKQRRELIEELTEYYRIVGTRDSYNLLNILQNNLKLIDMQQLFTPNGAYQAKETAYRYISSVTKPGSGYELGDYLKTEQYPNLEGIVTEIDENHGITKFELFTQTDRLNLTLDSPLIGATQGLFSCSSSPSYYGYTAADFLDSHDFRPGQVLHTFDDSFGIQINDTDENGRITDFNLIPAAGPTYYNLINAQLYESSNAFYRIKVTSKVTGEYEEIYSWKYTDLPNGDLPNLELEPGAYKVVISGAGGSGGSGDTEQGRCSDVECEKGYAGEEITDYVYLTTTTKVSGKIGQGGGATKAQGTWWWAQNDQGNGYDKGKLGRMVRGAWGHKRGWIVTSGQGGGSSGITIGDKTIIAKGGNGGQSGGLNDIWNWYLHYWFGSDYARNKKAREAKSYQTAIVAGGIGGSGGTTIGTGAKGGNSGYLRGSFWSDAGEDGYIKIYKANEITHYIAPLEDISNIEPGDQFELDTPYQKFLVTAYEENNEITLDLAPKTTTLYVNESSDVTPRLVMIRLGINLSAKLNLTSAPSKYRYNISLKGINIDRLKIGDKFTNYKAEPNHQFIYTLTDIDRTTKKYKGEATKVTLDDSYPITLTEPETYAYYRTGEGAELSITSEETGQTLYDRCYIDFYTKEELGAVLRTEYRINAIDYLYINQGTPNSPKWWDCENNKPDIDYGMIRVQEDDYINYGYISEDVDGHWVKWWEWDRDPNWYPTNHVIAEMKMPIDVNFSEFSKQFTDQFYNLASTVIYLHGIIESFYYGKENIDNTNPKSNTGASFGISTGAPIMTYEATVTSNPYIQYKQTIPDTCTLTITPIPADALVTLEYNEQIISGMGEQSITVPYNSEVVWTVEKEGFRTKSKLRNVKQTKHKYVMLEAKPIQEI